MNQIELNLKLYAIQSKDGKWLRTMGSHGCGPKWVTDMSMAKIYTKIGSARSQVTFWSIHYPKFGIPNLIEIQCEKGIILNEDKRVEKAKEKIIKEKINREIRHREWELTRAQEELVKAQLKIKNLNQLI